MSRSMPRGLKRGRASLLGGITVGVAVLILWALLMRDLGVASPASLLGGGLIGIGVATWIRLADL